MILSQETLEKKQKKMLFLFQTQQTFQFHYQEEAEFLKAIF